MRRRVMDALRQTFRPEFLNRVDEVIIFHSLTREQLGEIVDIQLRRLERRLSEQRLSLQITPAARNALADEGYDPIYGARPLRRAIQRRIQDPLAVQLLRGEFKAGDTIVVDWGAGEFTFQRAPEAEPVFA